MGIYLKNGTQNVEIIGGKIGLPNGRGKILKGWEGDANNFPRMIFSAYTPPDFQTATNAEIIEALQKHYAGEVDLAKYWKVGQWRYANHSGYADRAVIIGFNHDTITKTGIRDKSALTLMTSYMRVPPDHLDSGNTYRMNKSTSNLEGWGNSALRLSEINKVGASIYESTTNYNVWKNVIKNCVKTTGKETTTDRYFIPSEYELFGESINSAYADGEQYEFFKNPDNRIFMGDKNGGFGSTTWLRSPYKGDSQSYCAIKDGVATSALANGWFQYMTCFCV